MFDLRSFAQRALEFFGLYSVEDRSYFSHTTDEGEEGPFGIRTLGPNSDNGNEVQSLFPLGSPFSTESSVFEDDLFSSSSSSMFEED